LLGQRPARRACRPRHDADAGCRNPEEAEAIPNRFACPTCTPFANLNCIFFAFYGDFQQFCGNVKNFADFA